MSEGRYPFIFISNTTSNDSYTSPQRGRGGPRSIPSRNRQTQGQTLTDQLNEIWLEFQNTNTGGREAVSMSSREGHYLEFKSKAGFDLITKSLENISKGIRLLNIREIEEEGGIITMATVYIPVGKEGFFLQRIEDYLNPEKNTNTGKPRNAPLVNSIEDIKAAILESFWQDANSLIPNEVPEWCEIWLRTEKEKGEEIEAAFRETCDTLGIPVKEGVITFPERLVVLAQANKDQLQELIRQTDFLAEIRKARETIEFFTKLSNIEQVEWVEDLKERLVINQDINTVICILDTGVNNGHQLISPVLKDEDLQSYDEEWGVNDHDGHGTKMSGVAIFGDLSEAVQSTNPVEINHILESGKILPPKGNNEPELYGYIMQQVIYKAEIKAPNRNRIICMAVSQDDFDRGKPSSWSGAVDALSSGAEDGNRRLIILAAGNVVGRLVDYPNINQVSSIESPGQSWNALTVGAYTSLVNINDPSLSDYRPIAPSGGLSPFSTTSLTWEKNKWAIKPDVLFEGGNAAVDTTGFDTECDDLSVLTTNHRPTESQFESFQMTSAATAKAAWMAAQIQSQYPELWAETIRGLIVHSADWTETMKEHFLKDKTKKADYLVLLRTCGYGVPNLDKALYCRKNNLTLIAEKEIQPFDKKQNGSYVTKDMHFYEIPWPKDVLLELGNTPIKMRVTLSYFIEPGPGEIGWKDRYRYRSHGLKFDVNTANETREQFKKRVNAEALAKDEKSETKNDTKRWTIGLQNRHLGSIHSDMIEGTAAEIATCNFIGVFPVFGWWKERTHLKKWNKTTRYSLIISIETPEIEVDLYTPVAVKLQIPIVT